MSQMVSRHIGALAAIALVGLVGATPVSEKSVSTQANNGVPSALMKKLNRGVNITRWFCNVKPTDTTLFRNYLVQDDLQNFKRLGVNYIRLCVSPDVIYKNGIPDPTNLPLLDAGIASLEKAGLAVLLDLHDNGQMKLDEPQHDNSGFIRFWEAMAKHYKGRQESSTVFELLNEPVFQKNPETWYQLQNQTVKAIRAIDPKRTILVASTGWNGIDTMVTMKPLAEKNLIYSFHCYDPFLFTHQGATWTGEQQKVMRDIPFPSSPTAVEEIISKIPEQYQGSVRDYGNQRLGKGYLHDRLSLASNWGHKNRVPVLFGEFGAYPPVSPKESRARWFDAMHDIIAELSLPNAVWGYDDGFGLGREKDASGKVKLDELTLKHLYKMP